MNLASAFADSVQKHREKTALFWGEREYSYQELWCESVFVSANLREQFNVKPGDRVGLWLKNCPEFVPALFGALHCGAVLVPINNFLKPDEVSFILSDAGIDVIVTDTELSKHFQALKAARPALKLLNVENLLGGLRSAPQPVQVPAEAEHGANRQESDLAVLIYTSGTTGRPKGAMLSHGNLLHNVESCRLCLQTVEAGLPGRAAADVSQLHVDGGPDAAAVRRRVHVCLSNRCIRCGMSFRKFSLAGRRFFRRFRNSIAAWSMPRFPLRCPCESASAVPRRCRFRFCKSSRRNSASR